MPTKRAQKKTPQEKTVQTDGVHSDGHRAPHAIVLSSYITEKSTVAGERSGYAFIVAPRANKKEIARAIFELFKVSPVAVRVINRLGKQTSVRGTNRHGRQIGKKIAYVYLKKGETIDIS
ncbi:MAG: uL23 family ribosomal protein [Minisyncoccia bacterium]